MCVRNTPRVVIVGCGSIGRRHARNLSAAGVREILVVDSSRAAAEATAAECGAHVTGSLGEALDRGARVCFICTPSDLHIRDAVLAASRGADLFIEKPLSHSLEGVDALTQEAQRRRLITMVGCNMRFHPGPQTVRRLLDEGAIGAVLSARIHAGSYLPRWRPAQDYRSSYSASVAHGGAILDCIHEIDLALWYFGAGRLHSAAALSAAAIGLETDGLAELLVHHTSGVLTSIHLNFIQRDYSRSCLVIGTEGTIEWVFRDRQVRVFGADGSPKGCIAEPEGWDMNAMYVSELNHFLDAVDRREPAMNSIPSAIGTLRLALDARSRASEVSA